MPNRPPSTFQALSEDTGASGFTMASDPLTGSLLRTLAATKPGGRFLELGTGTGLSTCWLLDGMDRASSLESVDNDGALLSLARTHLGGDDRLELVQADAGEWILSNAGTRYDLIFADTWHGKYRLLEETLALLKPGGIYVVDDMLPQPNWPEGHDRKAELLIGSLNGRDDLVCTRLDWSTGIIIGVKP